MIKIGADIGGTFTDVVLDRDGQRWSVKILTTHHAPEEGLLAGVGEVLRVSGIKFDQVNIFVHGTTLATNALIERRGAKVAFITTDGFRDTLEMAYESRFEQYNLNIDLPAPLVRRRYRLPVRERIGAHGEILIPLNEDDVRRAAETIAKSDIPSVAVGFLNSYANPAHEQRTGNILRTLLPNVSISLSAEVSPEMREYERFSTVCANAYVKPLMASYLDRLERKLREQGLTAPLYLMLSGGGITTIKTAAEFPVRLVESGPAGGAIFAAQVARECNAPKALSFDMGGTTAKICFIQNMTPQKTRRFEVARTYRFKRGSGLPLRIPVIEMVEIGAGGGSVVSVDKLGNVAVGPESAGSSPGPACYDRGGKKPTVTDADLILGRNDPANFAGGSMTLNTAAAIAALKEVAETLGGNAEIAAAGVSQIVDENMANAARMHAIESGNSVRQCTLIAFGGAAPLHALSVAERLAIDRVIVPAGAGVGSAIGFIQAPVSYEVTRSLYQDAAGLELERVNQLLDDMRESARAVVSQGDAASLQEERVCFMRYKGQGHELPVTLPDRSLTAGDGAALSAAFETEFKATYGRTMPHTGIEIVSWSIVVTQINTSTASTMPSSKRYNATTSAVRTIFDEKSQRKIDVPLYRRSELRPGASIQGPAIIAEDETTTIITDAFDANINPYGYIECIRRERSQ